MGLLHGIWLVLLGGLGAASLVARRPEGRKALSALEPYQGWIGVVSVVVGVWHLIVGVLGGGFIRWACCGRCSASPTACCSPRWAWCSGSASSARSSRAPRRRRSWTTGPGRSSPTVNASASPPWCWAAIWCFGPSPDATPLRG